MDENQVLIDCWRLVEKHGHRPTIKGTMRMAREVGARFDEHDARKLLRPFLQKSTPLAPRSNPESTPPGPHVHPDATPLPPTPERGTYARSKGTPSSLFEATPPPDKPVKPVREDKRTDAEKTADAAMLLLLARIQPYLHGMTVTTWRKQNRRVVVDMVQSGMTVPEIDAAHDHIRDGAGNPYVVLDWFQKKLAVQGVKPPEPERPRAVDLLPPEQREAIARREHDRRVAAGES